MHIFGKEIRSINIYFPSQIPDFIERLPPNDICTFDYIVNNHTVIPFYSVFVSSEDALNIKSALKNNESNKGFSWLRSLQGTYGKRLFLRYCPICVSTDRIEYGETYWHRLHQIPDIEICPIHGCYLIDSSAPLKEFNQISVADRFISTSLNPQYCDASKQVVQQQLALATDTAWILENWETLPNIYAVMDHVFAIVDKDLLGEMVSQYQFSGDENQPEHRRRGKLKKFDSPFHFLVLLNAVGLSFAEFVGKLEVDGQLPEELAVVFRNLVDSIGYIGVSGAHSPNKMQYKHLEFSEKKEKYRADFLAILQREPQATKVQLREKYGHLYCWLRDNDNPWLREHAPANVKFDYKALDREFAAKVEDAALRIKAIDEYPKRVSIEAIELMAGLRGRVRGKLDKLPLTASMISRHVESREEFALRKLAWAVADFQKKKIIPSRYQLIRHAGIENYQQNPLVKPAIDESMRKFSAYR